MQPEYTIIEHVDSNRSYHTQEARAARMKGLPFISYQYVRSYPRDVEFKRTERSRKRAAKARATGKETA